MSKATDLMSQIDTNFQLTTTDLVAGLVSKWEGKLYALKDELSAQIQTINKSIASLEKTVLDEARAVLDIRYHCLLVMEQATVKYDKPELQWEKEYSAAYNNTVRAYVKTEFNLGSDTEYAAFNSRTTIPIAAHHVTSYYSFVAERTELNERLVAVMCEIKNISRKERELKAVLVNQKMVQLGINNPFEDEQLLQLLEVKI
jgi:hypothetical protein